MVGNFANLIYNGVGLILRPEGLVFESVSILFNYRKFDVAEIDLKHINKGKRNTFTANDVAKIVGHFIHQKCFIPSATKQFDDEACSYFALSDDYMGLRFRLVFCVCSDRPNSLGIITLYRI